MGKWKGKKVSHKRLQELRSSVLYRLNQEETKWGFNYKRPRYTVGGNKNSIINNLSHWTK